MTSSGGRGDRGSGLALTNERDGMNIVAMLVDAWYRVSGHASTATALAAIASTAERVLGAQATAVSVRPGSPAGLPSSSPRTLDVPVVGSRGEVVATIHAERPIGAASFSAGDQALASAFGLMAAILIERSDSERNLRAVLEHSPAAIFVKDNDLRYVVANRSAAEMLGVEDAASVIGYRDRDFLPPDEARRVMASDQAILDGTGDLDVEEDAHWPLEGRRLHVHAFAVRGDDGAPIGVGGVVTDVTAHRLAEAAAISSERQYALILEHALDAVVIADQDGRTVQVNPACSTLLDWSRAELLGHRLSDLVDDVDQERAGSAWDAFDVGDGIPRASRGYVRLRRRDGAICEAEYSAVANVQPGVHLGVLRDATERRQTERLTRQRDAVIEALVGMSATATLDALANAACAAMVAEGDFTEIAILAVDPPSRIEIVGRAIGQATEAAGLPGVVEGPQAEAIIAKAATGAWVDDWADAEGRPSRSLVEGIPISAVAWAPVRANGQVIALLAVGSPVVAVEQKRRLASLVDLASIVAGSTLGRSLREHSTRGALRARMQDVLATGAFHTVFQSLVDLGSGLVFGYEALTRFADGTAPDVMFAAAKAIGQSLDLEVATARAALAATEPLPVNRTINLNVSPDLILAGEPLRSMLRASAFGIILEITEHSEVRDYAELRAAIASLGPDVRVAVDDAGAGFSSLRHIIELRPAMVKLDTSLTRGIDTDLARQALVAGLVHFAARLEFELLAEGVETQAERGALLELGVTRAQGYLFGRPATVEAIQQR